MSGNESEHEHRWGYAFAGVLAVAFAAVIQFAFGELDADTAEMLPSVFGAAYAIAGKYGLTVPLAFLGACLILWDVARGGGGQKHQAAATKTAAVAKLAAEPVSPAAEPAANGKIRGGWRGSGMARRGKTVNASEEGEEVVQHGPMSLEPVADDGKGRVKLATERYMNWAQGTK